MKTAIALVCVAALSLSGCSTTDVMKTWEADSTGRTYSNALVAAVITFPDYRSWIERDLAKALRATGAKARAIGDIHPSSEPIDKETATAIIRDSGADAVVVVRLVDLENESVYTPGAVFVEGGYNGRYGFGWYGYYGNAYRIVRAPGYTAEYREFTVETTLFDTATNKRVWSTVTKTTEVRDSDAILSYLRIVGEQLQKSGLFDRKN